MILLERGVRIVAGHPGRLVIYPRMQAFGTQHGTNKCCGKLQHVEGDEDLKQSAKGYGRKTGEISKGQL